MTLNRSAQDDQKSIEEKDFTTQSTPKILTTLFDQRSESGRIRPMYEDTDSESVTSVKSANNFGDKELKKSNFPKPISQSLKVFELEKQDIEILQDDENPFLGQANTNSDVHHKNSIDIYYDPEFDIKWQEEQNKLEKVFNEKRFALEKEHEIQLKAMEDRLEEKKNDRKIELESQHNVEVEKFKQQLKDELEEKRKILNQEHRLAEYKLQENHKTILQELERDLKTEEDLIKKDHIMNIQQMKDRMAHDLELERQKMRETGDSHLYEKIRCEKRLLEDKYRCLKDKYVRLKNDVKISLERRHQRREQQSLTTGSETERSNSNKQTNVNKTDIGKALALNVQQIEMERGDRSALIGERSDKKFTVAAKYLSHIQSQQCPDDTSISQSDTTVSNNCHHNSRRSMPYTIFADNGNLVTEAFQQENNNNVRESHGKQRNQKKKQFTRTKSASTSRLNSSNLRSNDQLRPVENLRRQLEKLEDLEDQFPDNSVDTTYHLRYPFKVESGGKELVSSELEFFKHRIHLERDSVRRAKESLHMQRSNFRARQREVKNHHKDTSRHTVDQMIQEEKELTEMEVNLHRTRSLLGEKVIRLRHLEQSLQRLYDNKEQPHGNLFATDIHRDDATISDLSSSHSSSGFSSTDFASDTHRNDQRKEIYQESTEIIQSLEQLNAEIREIWDILSKQQTQGLAPPPSLIYQDIMWPTSQVSTTLLPEELNQQHCATSINYALNQPVIRLSERLDHYRLASSRIPDTVNSSAAILSQSIAANTMVSQSPLAQTYKTSLVERTQDLRNWLKQAKNEHELLSSTQQADL
ncbi:girdin-like [Contarinia nasturtii]|uniref:girdin-like n=1 Tax=Contarinia nasturtii TaxID=265458 RepID=UPI0012D3D18A|nr:girdin-like [Contarinia nasturtii]